MSIKAAAIKDKNGKVYTGRTHCDIKNNMPPELIEDAEEGFVTDSGYFCDRIEAAKIALACHQIHTPVDELRSCDLM